MVEVTKSGVVPASGRGVSASPYQRPIYLSAVVYQEVVWSMTEKVQLYYGSGYPLNGDSKNRITKKQNTVLVE